MMPKAIRAKEIEAEEEWYDKKCKWHKSCGYDFCHGEGICPEFERGKPQKEEDDGMKYALEYLKHLEESEVERDA